MTTNLELKKEVQNLQDSVKRLQASNNRLRDDVEQLKNNHGRLVEGVNKNIEHLVTRFQNDRPLVPPVP